MRSAQIFPLFGTRQNFQMLGAAPIPETAYPASWPYSGRLHRGVLLRRRKRKDRATTVHTSVLARNIVLINPLEQSVKFLDPALCLCELSAFCSQLFFEFFFTLGAEFFTEQVLTIGYVPKKDLQEFQYTLFQYHCTDKVCSTHIFAFLPRGRTNKVILPVLAGLRLFRRSSCTRSKVSSSTMASCVLRKIFH